jgi:hypothetical protein
MRVLVLLLALVSTAIAEDFRATKIYVFEGEKRFSAPSLDNVTLADADKKVIVMSSKPGDGPYLSIGDQNITIHDGENPIVLTGETRANFLKGIPVAYGDAGSAQLFNATNTDFSYVLLTYDKDGALRGLVQLTR